MPAYYNEIDPYAADWLDNLIAAGHIAPGVVDRRSIEDVRPDDLHGFEQCHFFAGLGGWSLALRLAGLPDTSPVWTGSCPCQPFSAAGKRGGTADERHLWPAFFHLIEQCGPATVLGEQVASRDGLDWLDLVLFDLEGAGYDVGAADLCAASVGAPHIRQRSWFVADAHGGQPRQAWGLQSGGQHRQQQEDGLAGFGLADTRSIRRIGRAHAGKSVGEEAAKRIEGSSIAECSGGTGGVGNNRSEGRGEVGQDGRGRSEGSEAQGLAERSLHERARGHNGGPVLTFWSECDWIACRGGKARPVEPGTFPLAHGVSSRVGRLRAYGNAIVPQVAATFIQAAIPFRLGVFA
jgi:DNA (cytosine-5)-methyltransferase 1